MEGVTQDYYCGVPKEVMEGTLRLIFVEWSNVRMTNKENSQAFGNMGKMEEYMLVVT